MVTHEIFNIAKKANLLITVDNKKTEIKHKFRFRDKSIWGVLFFSCGGILLIILPFIKASDTTTKVLGVITGVLFFTLSILTLIRQVADKLRITDSGITFRYNLKQTSMPLERGMKIKMKTEVMEISRAGTVGSAIISVTHYLQTLDKEIPVLTFQMDNSNANKAIELGNTITGMISKKLRKVIESKTTSNVSE